MTKPVHIEVLPIPDRIDGDRLRLCVQMTPTETTCPGGSVRLSHWPQDVLCRARAMRVVIAKLENGVPVLHKWGSVHEGDTVSVMASPSRQSGKSVVDVALAKWQEIFDDFDALYRAVAPPASGGEAKALAQGKILPVASPRAEWFNAILDQTFRDALASSLAAESHDGTQSASFIGGKRGAWNAEMWIGLADVLDFGAKAAAVGQQLSLASRSLFGGADPIAVPADPMRQHIDAYGTHARGLPPSLQDIVARHIANNLVGLQSVNTAFGLFGAAIGTSDTGPDPREARPDSPPIAPEEHAARKLSGMLSFPTLAKYFGLCTDILLDPNTLGGLEYGLIAIELVEPGSDFPTMPDPATLRWTAFHYGPAQGRKALHFGTWDGKGAQPRPIPAFDDDLYWDGVVNLQQSIGGVAQFTLGSGDVVHTMLRLSEKASRIAQEYQTGVRLISEESALVERSSTGITLYRGLAKERLEAQLVEEGQMAANPGVAINRSGDLVHGLRYDMLLEPDRAASSDARWRPLTTRIVTYDEADVDGAFLAHPAVVTVRYRDDTVAMSPAGSTTQWVCGVATQRPVTIEEMMQWGGGSLAVSSAAKRTQIDPKVDLGIGITFDLHVANDGLALSPPPLRYGREYRLRARVGLPLGCGLTFADLQADLGAGDYVLPAGGSTFVPQRHERLRAPEVLLPWDSDLVTKPDRPATKLNPNESAFDTVLDAGALQDGRTIQQMVVSSRGGSYDRDVRYILPARTSLDDWERQGLLDHAQFHGAKVPQGAFEGNLKLALFGPDGAFAEAKAGSITWYDPANKITVVDPTGAPATGDLSNAKSRGPVLVLDPQAFTRQRTLFPDSSGTTAPQPRYRPDRFARVLVARLNGIKGYPSASGLTRIEFWRKGEHPVDALPAMIELRRGKEGSPAELGRVNTIEIKPPNSGKLRIPCLTVTVPPGDIVELELFADGAEPQLARVHFGFRALADAARGRGALARLKTYFDEPSPLLQDTRVLRLIHAVERPLHPPIIQPALLRAVTVTVRAETSQASTPETWRQRVNNAAFNSDEGGAVTYFVGVVQVHRQTTGRLRCEVRWADFGPTTIKREPGNGQWFQDAPNQYARVFDIASVGSPLGLADVDITRDESGEPRALAFAFKDGRARQLAARLVATSRFTGFFPAESPVTDLEKLGRFDLASASFDDAADTPLWTQCVFRPPPPIVDRVLPRLRWTDTNEGLSTFTCIRSSILRIFLDPAWYSSGENELLALVFDTVARPICDYGEAALEPFSRFLTRWGRDPVRQTAAVGQLRPEHVLNGVAVPKELNLHAGASDMSAGEVAPHKVKVIVLRPILDPIDGLHCDVAFGGVEFERTFQSYMPFVQLGLARYQEHSVDGLELSRPIDQNVQLLPDRRAVVRVDRRKVTVQLFGPVFTMAGAIQPYLSARLMETRQEVLVGNIPGEAYWVPASDIDGRLVERRGTLVFSGSGKALVELYLQLPQDRNDVHYGILLEEFELLPADPIGLVEQAPRGSDPLAGTTPTVRGPSFTTTIDLRQL